MAYAEAPKHEEVAAASPVPSFPFEVKLIILGRTIAAKTVIVSHNARDVEITTITLKGVIGAEVKMNETMTPKIASPKTSSTTAQERLKLRLAKHQALLPRVLA